MAITRHSRTAIRLVGTVVDLNEEEWKRHLQKEEEAKKERDLMRDEWLQLKAEAETEEHDEESCKTTM